MEHKVIFSSQLFLQITEVQTQVSQNTEALKGAQTEVNELRRQIQTLEIDLESQRSLVRNTQSAHTSFTPTHAYLNSLQCRTQHSHFKSLTFTLLTQASHSGDRSLWSCHQRVRFTVKILTRSILSPSLTESLPGGHAEGHRDAL